MNIIKIFSLIFRVALGGLFIWSGYAKLMVPHQEFFAVVLEYNIFPYQIAEIFSYLLPWFEISAGALLVMGFFASLASGAIALMLLSFIIALIINLFRGNIINDCGCFGSFEVASSMEGTIIRNIVLFSIALYLTIKPSRWFSVGSSRGR